MSCEVIETMLAFFLSVLLSANPGEAVRISTPNQPGLDSVRLVWPFGTTSLVRADRKWTGLVGMDLEAKPGRHQARLELRFGGGRVESRELQIEVREKKFPVTKLQVEDRFVQLNPRDIERSSREAEELRGIHGAVTPELLFSAPFQSPIPGRSGSNFGHRREFNGEARAPHGGADLRAGTGTPVLAANRGQVVLAKALFFTGNTVVLDHGQGIHTLYAHLSRIIVSKGSVVDQGQRLGLAGATGRVTGPHLHWAVRVQGARVDPFSLLSLVEQEIP